jgi:hypothetical protein
VVLEHDSKVSQLQLVCSASALQVSVVQKMNAQDFKWLTQMRGTPLPNQPDLYYFRCVVLYACLQDKEKPMPARLRGGIEEEE